MRILSKENVTSFLLKESVLYHTWLEVWTCQALFTVSFLLWRLEICHTNLHKALEVTLTFLGTSLKYSLDKFRTEEGQVAEELASLIPEHSQRSSDLKVPDPVSSRLSYPTVKGHVKMRMSLTYREKRARLIQPQSRKSTPDNTAMVLWG